jgi:uncharacterized membrane protein YfcA
MGNKFVDGFKEKWSMFLPFCLFFPCWLLVGSREEIFSEAISTYYPMMIAMVIGSMIAGSTPLGGGIVAFPVSVTILGFQSTMGRDFSLMIQSFGMSSASFLIFYKKTHLIREHADLLCSFAFFSAIGLVIGMGPVSAVLSSYVVDLIYATIVVCLVMLFIYEDILVRMAAPLKEESTVDGDEDAIAEGDEAVEQAQDEEEPAENRRSSVSRPSRAGRRSSLAAIAHMAEIVDPSVLDPPEETGEHKCKQAIVHYVLLPLFAIFGGILSSLIGSGTDIAFYFYGSILNATEGEHGGKRMNGNTLTAISVIVMATMSVFGSLLRITAHNDPELVVYPEVFLCLFATSPIVTLGAPTGSLLLKPEYEQYLKLLFYALGFLQLVVFGLLKFKSDATAWLVVGCCMGAVIITILTHFFLSFKMKKDEKEEEVSHDGTRHRKSRPSLLAATL